MASGAFITRSKMEQNGQKIKMLQDYMNKNNITDKDLKSKEVLGQCFRALGFSRSSIRLDCKSVKYYIQTMGGSKYFREQPLELLCPYTAMAVYHYRIQKVVDPNKGNLVRMAPSRAKLLYNDLHKNHPGNSEAGPDAYHLVSCSQHFLVAHEIIKKSPHEPLDADRINRIKHFLRGYLKRKIQSVAAHRRRKATKEQKEAIKVEPVELSDDDMEEMYKPTNDRDNGEKKTKVNKTEAGGQLLDSSAKKHKQKEKSNNQSNGASWVNDEPIELSDDDIEEIYKPANDRDNEEKETKVDGTEAGRRLLDSFAEKDKQKEKSNKQSNCASWRSRYKINDIVYAKRENNIFWPAKVVKICECQKSVTLSFLSSNETQSITSTDDIKPLDDMNVS